MLVFFDREGFESSLVEMPRTLRMVVGMLGQRKLCIAHLGPFSGAEETQIPKTNVRVEDKKVL